MNAPARSLLIRLSLITLLFGAAGYFVKHSPLSAYYLPAFPLLLLIFAVVYFLFSALLLPPKPLPPKQFINRFILLTGFKFLFLLFVIIIWLLLNRDNAVIFLAYVLVLYFGFSIVAYSSILSGKNTPTEKTQQR